MPKYSSLIIKAVVWYIVLFEFSVYEIDNKGIIVLLDNSYVSVLIDTLVFPLSSYVLAISSSNESGYSFNISL